jgi:hypothetical protein
LPAVLTIDDRAVSCDWPSGAFTSLDWKDLQEVEIRTTDRGPFEEDVFLVLRGAGREVVVPQGAARFGELLGRLQQLPGFDNEAVISSMTSAENAVFPCWRKEEKS